MQWSREAGISIVAGSQTDLVIAADVAYPLKDNASLLQMFGGMLTATNTDTASRLVILLAYGWRDVKAGKVFVEQLAKIACVTEMRRTEPGSEMGGGDGIPISVFSLTQKVG